MGFRPAPYLTIQYLYLALEFAVGNWRSVTNPLRWDKICPNLLASPAFNPSSPMVMKWNDLIIKCVDDIESCFHVYRSLR
jgi:hypothetical protein